MAVPHVRELLSSAACPISALQRRNQQTTDHVAGASLVGFSRLPVPLMVGAWTASPRHTAASLDRPLMSGNSSYRSYEDRRGQYPGQPLRWHTADFEDFSATSEPPPRHRKESNKQQKAEKKLQKGDLNLLLLLFLMLAQILYKASVGSYTPAITLDEAKEANIIDSMKNASLCAACKATIC